MKKGDEQRIEAVNENDEVVTYELVLLDIDVKRTDGPEKAASSSRGKRSKRSARSVEDAKGNDQPLRARFPGHRLLAFSGPKTPPRGHGISSGLRPPHVRASAYGGR